MPVDYAHLPELLRLGREIWGQQKLDAAGVLVRLSVDVGKLARYVRAATKDSTPCQACDGRGSLAIPDPPTEPIHVEYRRRCDACKGTGRIVTLQLEIIMGNILFSTIRWCDDLGIDPVEACRWAAERQRRFAAENPSR